MKKTGRSIVEVEQPVDLDPVEPERTVSQYRWMGQLVPKARGKQDVAAVVNSELEVQSVALTVIV